MTPRPATADDAAAIVFLVRAAWAASIDPRSSGHRLTEEGAREVFTDGGGFLIEDADGPVGCICWRPDGDTLDLMKLAVLPRARGRGLALALVEAVEALAAERGYRRVLLAVSVYNLSVIPFYEKLGYAVDETAVYRHASASSPGPVVMTKALAPRDPKKDEVQA